MAVVAVACLDMGADYERAYPVESYQNIVVKDCQGMIVATLPLDMIAVAAAYSPRKAVVAAMTATVADKVDKVDWIDRLEKTAEQEIEIAPALRAYYSH